MLHEDTPAVLSLGKLCEDHGYSYERTSGQTPQLIKDCRRIKCSTENYAPTVRIIYGKPCRSVPTHRDAPANSSRESAPEPLGQAQYLHSLPEGPKFDICMRTKITSAPCRKRTAASVPRAENFGDLITADHKVQRRIWISKQSSMRCRATRFGNSMGSILSVQKKPKLLRKQKRAYKSSWSRRGNQKSCTLTIPLNLAKFVKNYPGIIVRQHHTDRKRMGLLGEWYAGLEKGHLQFCCNQVWMKNGGRIPWNVTASCETCKISCLLGRHHMKGVLGNHLKDRLFHLVRYGRISPYFCERLVATASVRQESLTRNIRRLCIIRGENLERRHIGRRHWRFGKDGRIWNPC